MPFTIDRDGDILLVRFSGTIDAADVRRLSPSLDAMRGDAVGEPPRLADLRAVTGISIGFAEIHAFVAYRRGVESRAPVKVAFLVNSTFLLGMARMYQSLRSDERVAVQIFREEDEARTWLGE